MRDDLKNKSTSEIKKILEDKNKLEDATADEKFDKGKVYYGKVKNSGEDITIPPADSNGKTIIEAKVQNADTGDYEKKIIKIDQTSLKKKVNITHKTDVENIIKKKASSND